MRGGEACGWRRERGDQLAWIGPTGTFTGLHCDHLDNLVVQVVGSKRFKLAPPSDSPSVYPTTKSDSFAAPSGVEPRPLYRITHPPVARRVPKAGRARTGAGPPVPRESAGAGAGAGARPPAHT